MKTLSILKLELQAAVLATTLREDILKALNIPLSCFFMWTHSTTVLQWLHSVDKQPIFVANRVCEILESTSGDQWHHVATADNPADAGTRSMSADALKASSWLYGPAFLKNTAFPLQPDTFVIDNIQLKRDNRVSFLTL